MGWCPGVEMPPGVCSVNVSAGNPALVPVCKEAQPIGTGVTTLGIPIALGVIIFTIVITGIYVSRANGEYDRLTAEILKEAAK